MKMFEVDIVGWLAIWVGVSGAIVAILLGIGGLFWLLGKVSAWRRRSDKRMRPHISQEAIDRSLDDIDRILKYLEKRNLK
jgi:hypothetical protein